MYREELIAVASDTHLGTGGKRDDFRQGDRFCQFLSGLEQQNKNRLTLLLNGDVLDLVQSLADWPNQKPQPIDVLLKIKAAHQLVFQAIEEFSTRHLVIWVKGNHDWLLQEREWSQALLQLLPKISFWGESFVTTYYWQGQHVRLVARHGHQYDSLNRLDENGRSWGNAMLELIINVLEEWFPELDNVSTLSLVSFLKNNLGKVYERMTGKRPEESGGLFTLLTNLFNHKPEYKISLVIKALEEYLKAHEQSEQEYRRSAKKLATGSRQYRGEEVVIATFGHTHHVQHVQFDATTLYVNSGCWVDEVRFDEAARKFVSFPRANYLLFGSNLDPFDPTQTIK